MSETKMTTGKPIALHIMMAIYKQSHGTEFGFVKDDAWIKKIQPLALLFFSRNDLIQNTDNIKYLPLLVLSEDDSAKCFEGFKELYSVLTDYKNSLS